MPSWSDLLKIWTWSSEDDPVGRRRRSRDIEGAGVASPEAIPDLRSDGGYLSASRGSVIRLRDSTDFIDLSSITNRQSRYKEYERLRTVAEIETALTVFADESCVAGDTKVATPFGYIPIERLAKEKEPDEQFLVYCYDFEKKDYTLGWAYHPRLVKKAKTLTFVLDNGTSFSCTHDHRILLRTGEWIAAENLKEDDELMPFYRLSADQRLTKTKMKQFSRVFTFRDNWKTERQFIEEWKTGKKTQTQERLSKLSRLLGAGLGVNEVAKLTKVTRQWNLEFMVSQGFTPTELKALKVNYPDRRYIVNITESGEKDVYDLSVKGHENFATDTTIFHNCQVGENNHLFEITCKNKDIKEELDFLFFHPKMLNIDRKLWNIARNLYLRGDHFIELIIDPEEPKSGILKFQNLPADSVYRIETIKGKLLEFQQSKEGPDYQSLSRVEVTKATPAELAQATAIRFAPEQIVHFRIGDDRQTFYPYGVSLIEPARGPAHSLRLLEDSMLVYRLCLIGKTTVRTKNGWKYIKNIKVGDTVWTLQSDGNLVKTKVINFVNNGIKKVYTVKSKSNEITGTALHPILVHDVEKNTIEYVTINNLVTKKHQFINVTQDEETPAKIVRPKTDRMRTTKNQIKKYKSLKVPKKDLIIESLSELDLKVDRPNMEKCWAFLTRDCVSTPVVLAKKLYDKFSLDKNELVPCYRSQKNPQTINLPEYVDEDFARLFGFLLGDGCLQYDKKAEMFTSILFSTGEDETLNEKYKNLLARFFGRVVFTQDKRRKKGIGIYRANTRYGCEVLIAMGYICGAYNKRIPSWIFTERKSIRKAFIQGLVDADGGKRGTREKTWNSTIGMCNEKLVNDIREVWKGLGYGTSKIRKVLGRDTSINGKPIKQNPTWVVRITETPLPKYEDIISIKYSGKEKVYDITVDNEEHNFIANGIPVHNSRAPERRVFYIDVGQMPPFKAESFMERMKDSLRKKKAFSSRGGASGASPVDERFTLPSQDEDMWIPLRPNSNTRVETLPGAQNLGEVDDALYFRNKLFIALNFPKNYMAQEDSSVTRVTLSSVDVKFARLIERLQSSITDGLMDIAVRHLSLRGFPEELYEDLQLKMTPPSPWREMSINDVLQARYDRAMALKGSMIFSDLDIMTKILKIPVDEAKEIVSRATAQKLQELKLQVMAQNPELMGVTLKNKSNLEMGTDQGGPNPQLTGEELPGTQPAPEQQEQPQQQFMGNGEDVNDSYGKPEKVQSKQLPEPDAADIKKYDLEIVDFSKDIDEEELDPIELDE